MAFHSSCHVPVLSGAAAVLRDMAEELRLRIILSGRIGRHLLLFGFPGIAGSGVGIEFEELSNKIQGK